MGWVVSHICNKCEATGTAEVCDGHYVTYYQVLKIKSLPVVDRPRLVCGVCHGSLSYMAQHIQGKQVEEYIQ